MINFHAGSIVVRIVADATRFHAGILGSGAGISRLGLEAGRAASVLSTQFTPAANASSRSVNILQASLTRLGWTMTGLFGGPFALFGAASAKAFADFDKGMNDAIAAAGGVSMRVREDMERTIFNIAGSSMTSPAQMAQAYYYSVSAGLTAAQAQAGLRHIESFSVGGRMDIRNATDMINDIQFSLNLVDDNINKHAENVRRITDVIAMASVRSNATIEQIATSLVNKSATAMRLFNISLEEGTAALMVYAQQGTKAEVAGERLSIVLRDLQAVNITARRAWEENGLSVYDAAGKMRPLADIIEMLENRMRGFTDEQKRALLLSLQFPSRSVHALLPLIGKSHEIAEFHRMLAQESAGFNQDIAERTRQSFHAQMLIFWNNITKAAIEMGRALVPLITNINIQLKGIADSWLALNYSTRRGIVAFLGILALTGPVAMLASYVVALVTPFLTIAGILGVISTILSTGGLVVATALLVRYFGGLEPLLQAAGRGFGFLMENIGNFMLHFDKNMDILVKYFTENWQLMLRDAGIAIVAFVGAGLYWFSQLLGGLGSSIMRMLPDLLLTLAAVWLAIQMVSVNVAQAVTVVLLRILYNLGVMLTNGLVFVSRIIWSLFADGGLKNLLSAIAPYMTLIFTNILYNFNVLLDRMKNAIARNFPFAGLAGMVGRDLPFRGLMEGADAQMAQNLRTAFNDIGGEFRRLWRDQWQETTRWLINIIPDQIDWIIPWQQVGDVLMTGWKTFTDAIAEDMPNLIRMFGELTFPFQSIVDRLGGWQLRPPQGLDFTRFNGVGPEHIRAMSELQLMANPLGMGLGFIGNEILQGYRATQAAQSAGLLAGATNAGQLASVVAALGEFSATSRPAIATPAGLGLTMSGTNFQEISTRRFAIDGPFGLANTSTQKIGVRDDETHRLLREIIPGLNNPNPIVRRNN